MMEYVKADFRKAEYNYRISAWQQFWKRLLCKHSYEQTHPQIYKPDPTGLPEPPPIEIHGETKGEVWLYTCSKCDKVKSVPIRHAERMSKQSREGESSMNSEDTE